VKKVNLKIENFLGLNESPDGDSGLKPGEAADMTNFRITYENNLKKMSGYSLYTSDAGEEDIDGMTWWGDLFIFATDGKVFTYDGEANTELTFDTDVTLTAGKCTLFVFKDKLYILNGHEYLSWAGGTADIIEVVGYTPTILIASDPDSGAGTEYEPINQLIGQKIQNFNGDNSTVLYQLAETDITSVDKVIADGSTLSTSDYSVDLGDGTVTFDTAPADGLDNVIITWTKAVTNNMIKMKYVQFFGGENNTRVFVYGDGSNTIYYSELETGSTTVSAEYFPELNRMDIDLDSIPVTALVPYYSRLFIFKEDSVYYATYSTLTGDDGRVIVTFATNNVTKSVGCSVYNGALSVPNGIIFPSNDGVYIAKGGYVYEQMSENLISKRVDKTYKTFDQSNMLTLNNQTLGEAWFIDNNNVLVYNYRNDTWYKLDILESALSVIYNDGTIYFGNDAGEIFNFDSSLSYNGEDIDAYWESGSMDFGYFNNKKWIDRIWLTLKSEANSSVTVDLESDITSSYPDKTLSHGVATFTNVNFANFSFNTNSKPASKLARIKAKKFTFLKLILKNDSSTDTCTVMNITAPVEVGGITK